jgi:hypothetical protein
MSYTDPNNPPPGQHMRTKLRPLAALAMVALICAGCSSTSAGPGAGSSGATDHAKAVKFAECMRNNGVSEFPDPDATGKLTIDQVANGSHLNPEAPAFKQALSACKSLEPGGFAGHKRTPQEQAYALKFAQCIRANGVPEFPDPNPDAPLVDVNGGQSMPGLRVAMQKCRYLVVRANQ